MPKRVPRETRRAHVELVDIASPYTGTDRVFRRVDSLARLRGSGIIGDREMRAAERFRTACEMVMLGPHCALENAPGAISPASRTPALQALQAAETLKHARKLLGRLDYTVMHFVVNAGMGISEAAGYFGFDREHVGHRLRQALRQLADSWFGPESGPRNHIHRESDARPESGQAGELVPGNVAHASRKGVSYA